MRNILIRLVVALVVATSSLATLSSAPTSAAQCGVWRLIPSTLGRRDFATIVTTNEHLVIWGGDRGTGNDVMLDGQVLNFATTEWSNIVPRPSESSPTNIGHLGGDRFVFTGFPSAVYSVVSRSWTPIDLMADKNPPNFVSTPLGLFALPADRGGDPAVLLNKTTGAVVKYSAAPIDPRGYESAAYWVGSGSQARLVVLQASLPPHEPEQTASAQYDVRRNRWSQLPKIPLKVVAARLSATDGKRLFVLGVTDSRPDQLTLASWTPGQRRWKMSASKVPAAGVEAWWGSQQRVGSQMVSVGSSLVVVTPNRDPNGQAVMHVLDHQGNTRSFVSPGDIATQIGVSSNQVVALLRDGSVAMSCV